MASMKRKAAAKVDRRVWEKLKSTIITLYKDMTLEQVMAHMSTVHGLNAKYV